ncbi:MAG: hypothetical protein JRJ42_02145, partial [Deltaproteobacteria bacterium]|nr:hypothetical protein [Deltaproteobacteria bacterium]MBW2018912.1 hypothetical protein [Deltaproteobacteria bacterium]MBW2073667.1 hypothetical protein [Deltaproteobacteria bacterium]
PSTQEIKPGFTFCGYLCCCPKDVKVAYLDPSKMIQGGETSDKSLTICDDEKIKHISGHFNEQIESWYRFDQNGDADCAQAAKKIY